MHFVKHKKNNDCWQRQAEQVSYERSSQVQNLTDPPRVRKKLLTAAGLNFYERRRNGGVSGN